MASAVVVLAEKHNWNVVNLVSLGCPFGPTESGTEEECGSFYEDASSYILETKPDAVFTIATRTKPASADETLLPAFADTVNRYTEAGIEVIGVRDNPRFGYNMPECASENPDDLESCAWQKDEVVASVSPLEGFQLDNPRYTSIDMTDPALPGHHVPGRDRERLRLHRQQPCQQDLLGEHGPRVRAPPERGYGLELTPHRLCGTAGLIGEPALRPAARSGPPVTKRNFQRAAPGLSGWRVA
jgi:hypothetical protein